ncbi:hypothetical protein [Microbacterium sp. P02]|uniref:hypothetical protein n=1 Tax=Microbacterium sp. P02 TaxID=3366260 RepID=UPI00366BDF61
MSKDGDTASIALVGEEVAQCPDAAALPVLTPTFAHPGPPRTVATRRNPPAAPAAHGASRPFAGGPAGGRPEGAARSVAANGRGHVVAAPMPRRARRRW